MGSCCFVLLRSLGALFAFERAAFAFARADRVCWCDSVVVFRRELRSAISWRALESRRLSAMINPMLMASTIVSIIIIQR